MHKNIRNTISIILRVMTWLLFGFVIYWLILKIIGKSPTAIEIVLIFVAGLLTVILGFIIKMSFDMGELKQWTKNHDQKFNALASDFKEARKELHKLGEDFHLHLAKHK